MVALKEIAHRSPERRREMENELKEPVSLQEAVVYFADPARGVKYIADRRWPNGVHCPVCNGNKISFIASRNIWQCVVHHKKRQFSAKTGTIFEDSAIGLDKWMVAVWQVVNCKNGVSSYEIARALRVTQKTAWFMMHRVRLAMQTGSFLKKIGGNGTEVEVDETFIGGKARNMHLNSPRRKKISHVGVLGKTNVVGLLERGGQVRADVVPDRKRAALQGAIVKHVKPGSMVYTDNFMSYDNMPSEFVHKFVDHAESYVQGRVHTNGLENFWSLLKRGLKGTYVCAQPYHLFRYLDEQSFRYNNRATKDRPMNDGDRFKLAMSQIAGKRLTYKKLTGRDVCTKAF